MKIAPLGSIFANSKQLEAMDKFSDKSALEDEKFGDKHLKGYEKRRIGGELRYYKGEKFYAIVKNKKIKCFEVREDGEYATKLPS